VCGCEYASLILFIVFSTATLVLPSKIFTRTGGPLHRASDAIVEHHFQPHSRVLTRTVNCGDGLGWRGVGNGGLRVRLGRPLQTVVHKQMAVNETLRRSTSCIPIAFARCVPSTRHSLLSYRTFNPPPQIEPTKCDYDDPG